MRNGLTENKAREVTAIFKHETGNFKSRLFREQNNLSGMRHATIRDTTSLGSKNNYAFYCCLEDAIDDFLLWFKQYGCKPDDLNKMSLPEIITFMKNRNYFDDQFYNYYKGVKKWLA